jgi:protein disulfide-isomerase
MRILRVLFLIFVVVAARAADRPAPYNEKADAKQDLRQVLATATNTPIIVVFGANWCPDCLALDHAMTQGASATLLKHDFRIVKVDVGQKDKNLDLAASYGISLTNGIPAVVILSPKGDVRYVTRDGELSKARKMSDDGIYQFFKKVTELEKKS